jgi:two-component system copper resistance phosphate regulon response regulator CusR
LKNKKILILDDEEDICFLLSNFLKNQFKEVKCANTISEFKSFDLNSIDVIIVDNNLPDGFGFDIIPDMKSSKPEIKIIAISAFDANNERKYAMENGADLFLGKPFKFDDILQKIELLK